MSQRLSDSFYGSYSCRRRVAAVRRLAASVCVWFCLCQCLCVCPNDKTKTVESTITKLATGIVHHESHPPIERSKVKVRVRSGLRYELCTSECSSSYRQDLPQAALPVCFYSRPNFGVFRPAGATRCTDQGQIWQGGADRSPSLPNFTLIGSGVGFTAAKTEKNGILPI